MALRYGGRKLSFDVLNGDHGSTDDDEALLLRSLSDSLRHTTAGSAKPTRRRRKSKSSKKKKAIEEALLEEQITEKRVDAVFDDRSNTIATATSVDNDDPSSISYADANANGSCELDYQSCSIQTVICEEIRVPEKENAGVRTLHRVSEKEYERRSRPFVEVRRRSRPPSGTIDESIVMSVAKEGSIAELSALSSGGQLRSEVNGSFGNKLEKTESLDWNYLMRKNSGFSSVEKSPVKYFMGEIYRGHSLQGTTTLGNEKERERVYDTIFRLPWRCELIIDVGFFVCLDSFLSLLTIMPARILTTLWRCINTRQFQRPSAEELSDFSCLIVLACGVALLQQADISLIYHMIRGQGTIKLYVVYNVLEIFDRLCQNFGGDVLQTLFGSAKGLANSPPENVNFWLLRYFSDQALTIFASIAHSFVLLAQAITLSTCIVSHNNALLALLVSNNFAEIKSNVFKRFSKDNVHSLVYFDSIERFHISAFILFVLAQNILEAEGPWFGSFLSNALVVYFCEMFIDIIKHSFIAKFNEIKPIAYSEFLEDLCKQTLNMQAEDEKNNLTFVPLAPACVVIRVLTPVYAAHLPYGPLPWRLLWIFLLTAMTYVMLVSLKVMVGLGLHKHATWYVNRCQRRKLHSD